MLKNKMSEKDLENVSGGADWNDDCIGCGVCVDECPVQAVTLEGEMAYRDKDTCTNCNACIRECPMNTYPVFR